MPAFPPQSPPAALPLTSPPTPPQLVHNALRRKKTLCAQKNERGPSGPGLTRRVLVGTAVVVAGLALSVALEDAQAKNGRGPVNALTKHFSSLQVGPGHEFRLLVVHPLFGAANAVGPENIRLAAGSNPDTLGFSAPSGGRTLPLRVDNLIEERLLVLPGQIVRSDRFDLAFTDYVAVKQRSSAEAALKIISKRAPDDEPRPERAVLAQWLPPTLRWAVGPDGNGRDLSSTMESWARDAGLEGGRRSMADLAAGTVIRDRVGDYIESLRDLSRAPPGLQLTGYAAILDGAPVVIETFADGESFRSVWPELLRALAVEASVEEARASLLDQELPPSGQPDRLLPAVRKMLLSFFTPKHDSRNARHTGKVFSVSTARGPLNGLVLDKTVFVHAVIVTDPRRRGTEEKDDFDPGVISRKARPTQAEQRWLDRRRGRNPPTPPPPGGRPPTPPRPVPPVIPPTPK